MVKYCDVYDSGHYVVQTDGTGRQKPYWYVIKFCNFHYEGRVINGLFHI